MICIRSWCIFLMVKKVVLSSDIKLVVEFMLSYGLKLKRRAFFFSLGCMELVIAVLNHFLLAVKTES